MSTHRMRRGRRAALSRDLQWFFDGVIIGGALVWTLKGVWLFEVLGAVGAMSCFLYRMSLTRVGYSYEDDPW